MAGVFGVNARLDGVPAELDLVLGDRDRLPTGNPQLFGDQIYPCDHLGDRMFHLDAGIHFHEIKRPAAVHQEFHGAGALVANGAGGGHGGIAHLAAQVGVDGHAGSLFQQLLVAALDRAVALAQVDHVAVAIGQHLHFHVSGPVDEFLHVEARVAEGSLRFPLGRFEQALDLIGPRHQAHAAAAAASGGLDHHRIAHRFGQSRSLLRAGQQAGTTGDGGHPHPFHGGLSGRLISHRADGLGGGTHKRDAVVGADLGEAVVFGQKAVAGVNCVSTPGGGRRQNVGDVEVALAAGRFANAYGFVGELHVQGVFIHRAVDRDGGNAELPAGAQDA